MTKTLHLDELILNDRWFDAEVEAEFETSMGGVNTDYFITRLTEWTDGGASNKDLPVDTLPASLENYVVGKAEEYVEENYEWIPTYEEIREDAYETFLGV